MTKVYTVVKWRFSNFSWGTKQYTFNSILISFTDRKAAVKYIREELGAVYGGTGWKQI